MKNSKDNGNPISQNVRFVNPFSEKSFEGVIAQNLSDVKSFLKYFSESPEAQTEENVNTFFKIFSSMRNSEARLQILRRSLTLRSTEHSSTLAQ